MITWKEVPGYAGVYEITDTGRIRSLDRVVVGVDGVSKRMRGCELRPRDNTGGYLCVRLGRGNPRMVHQIVADAFLGPKPEGAYVCHGNGIKHDNDVGNLRYDTPQGNQQDRERHGTHMRGEMLPQTKLTEQMVREIRALAGSRTRDDIGKQYGVSGATVQAVLSRRNWKHIT